MLASTSLFQYGKWVWDLKNHIDTMFMDLFEPANLPQYNSNNVDREDVEGTGDGRYDTTQYDAVVERPPPLQPEDAGKLLLRTDNDVDFRCAWNVLRDMMADEEYKTEVLRVVKQLSAVKIS